MSQTRIEHDSMGEVRVPAHARYGAQTQRAVDNFPISGQRLPRALIRALGQVKAAAAVVHAREGRLPGRTGAAIAQAAQEVADGRWDDEFVVDLFQTGSGTSSNMNANEVIAHRARELLGGDTPVHPNDDVNAGQSSNDVFPTAVHLAAAVTCRDVLLPALGHLQQALAAKAHAFADVVKSGRTHGMDAVPVTLGQAFGGYARQVELGVLRVESALQRVVELPLGGTAVGTGLNAPPGFAAAMIGELRRTTGLDALREADDHFEAQGARDALVELSGALKVVAVSLTKIAGDLRWMASGPRTGLAEIRLPAVQPGSSIMPGKVNPVIAESLAQAAAQVIGNDAAVTVGGLSGVLELNACIPLIARNVLESIALLGNGCRNFADRCVAGIEADRERCLALAERNLSAVTALVPRLGYERAAALAQQALAQDRPLREVVRAGSGLAADEVDRLLDLAAMARGGLR